MIHLCRCSLMQAAPLLCMLLLLAACSRTPPSETADTSAGESPAGTAKDAPAPSYVPIGDPSIRGFETGSEYVVAGRVTDELMEPLPEATVRVYGSAPRWSPPTFEQPAPLDVLTCDQDGHYQLRLDAPANLWLSIGKEGYGQIYVFLPVRDPKMLARDFQLQLAQATVSGLVLDKKEQPIAAVLLIANPLPFTLLADNPVTAPIGRSADADGKYFIDGLPGGDVSLLAMARGYVQMEQLSPLKAGQNVEANFSLSQVAPITFAVKNKRGEAIPFATATVPGRIKIAGGDARGIIELRMPPEISPFECTVAAAEYQTNTIQVDPQSLPTVVVLEDKPVFRGRVLAESGAAVSGAVISLWGTGGPQGKFEDSAHADKMGRFAIPQSYPPAREMRVSASGFLDQRLVLDSRKPAPAETIVRLQPVEAGIFGRVIDYRGIPMKRFVVHLRNEAAGGGRPEFQRSYSVDNGRFIISDIVPGTYTLIVQSATSSTAEDVQVLKQEGVEIRKGFFFGEFIAQFPKPQYGK